LDTIEQAPGHTQTRPLAQNLAWPIQSYDAIGGKIPEKEEITKGVQQLLERNSSVPWIQATPQGVLRND